METNKSPTTVDEIMLEFGSYTCADVSLETVNIVYIPEEIKLTYQIMCDMWANFRRSSAVVEKYGLPNGSAALMTTDIAVWYRNNIFPVFTKFIELGTHIIGPYYLCACRESGDEYLIRRALPNDPYTTGKFMTMECKFSKMEDCVPRNKLAQTRGDDDGEYLLFIIHKPGTMEEQEKLRTMLTNINDGEFALI